jgi:glutathione S-transferase
MTDRPTTLALHDFALSGHCHRVRLMLALLGLPCETRPVDLVAGEHKQASFLALNPLGQVPVLRDGELALADSNAILVYLASRYGAESWLPREPRRAAAVQRWLSIAAGEIAFGVAAARAATLFGMPCDDRAAAQARGRAILGIMDDALKDSAFLAGPEPTIADVACYAYIARAPEGGVALEPHRAVRAWLERVESLPGFVAMPVAAGS